MNELLSGLCMLSFFVLWTAPLVAGMYGAIQLFLVGQRKDVFVGVVSVAFTALSAAAIVWLSVSVLKQYGIALFIGLPIYCGIMPVVIYAFRQPRSHWEAIGISAMTLLFLGVAIIGFALDGLICILMAAPLAALFTFTAAFVANSVMRSRHKTLHMTPLLVICASLPFMVGFEARCDLPPPTSVVTSSIDIAAAPDEVWKYIPAIPSIPDQPEMLFRAGVAYPLRSEMDGSGVGAKRLCVLSTGALHEVVTAWKPGRLLRFDVTSCPPSMHELSIYHDLQTPHLENFMVSEWGEFKLIPLPNGHTLVEGTSQYHNRMWPAEYWLPLSDWIVHRIHVRVLNFIKAEAEKQTRG